MSFVKFTANPKNETNDCIIRSIAKATDRPWQNVMKEMCDIAIEMYLMPNNSEVIEEYMYRRKKFVYSPSNPTTVQQFAAENPVGRFVICGEDHAIAIVDGDWYDLNDSANTKVVDFYHVEAGI